MTGAFRREAAEAASRPRDYQQQPPPQRRHHHHAAVLLLLLPLLFAPPTVTAFLPPAAPTAAAHRRSRVVVGMGGKWQKDPSVLQGVAELVKGFQEKQHAQTESVDRYLQDGMEAIKRLDARGALDAFETALRMDNETGLIWHHGAMLYYAGEYEAAVTHLDKVSARYEELFEQPATEEAIWRAAALYRLHGPERARTQVTLSQFGAEKRPLLNAVHALFRGEADAGALEALIEGARNHPYSSYELYGNFYLGLYHDAAGDREAALGALGRATLASKARPEDVMYHLPRLHLTLRERELFSSG